MYAIRSYYASFVQYLNRSKNALHNKPIFVVGEKDGVQAEVALQYNDSYQETVYAFANNINTHDGGTHLIGFRSALTRAVNQYAQKGNLLKGVKENLSGDDLREGLTAVVSVKVPEPQFEGQTKHRLRITSYNVCYTKLLRDEEDFAPGRVGFLAVGQLSGKTRRIQRSFSSRQLLRLARCLPRPGCLEGLLHDLAGDGRRFLEEVGKFLVDQGISYNFV